jgi:N-carbamoylputrescine amidase
MSTTADSLNIGMVQMRCTPDPTENFRRAVALIEQAAEQGAQLVCLPELFRSQYFCQREDSTLFDLAETIPGPTTDALAKVAKKRQLVLIAPVFEKRAAGLYHNSAVIIDADGTLRGPYRKMHIPDDPGYYEKYYFTPGDLGFQAHATAAGRIGVLLCWDQWFPEAARLTALQGADILFYPTAIGWHPREKAQLGAQQRDAWRTVQRGHAIANGTFVVAVNRVGLEVFNPGTEGLEFWGTSFIADPFGVVLAEAASDREEVIVHTLDLQRVEQTRRAWPFLRDRRIDAYAGLAARFADRDASAP